MALFIAPEHWFTLVGPISTQTSRLLPYAAWSMQRPVIAGNSAHPIHNHRPALPRRIAAGTRADRLHHPAIPEVLAAEVDPLSVIVYGCAMDQI